METKEKELYESGAGHLSHARKAFVVRDSDPVLSCNKAIESLSELVRLNPNHAGAWLLMGESYYLIGCTVSDVRHLRIAIVCCETALQRNPHDKELKLNCENIVQNANSLINALKR